MFAWAPDSAVPAPDVQVGNSILPVRGTATLTAGVTACWTGRGTVHEACAKLAGNGFADRTARIALRYTEGGSGYELLKGDSVVRGDSGSLLYEKTGSGVIAVGLIVAGSRLGGGYSGMIPIASVESGLGVHVLTS